MDENQLPVPQPAVPEKLHTGGRFFADAALALVGCFGLFIFGIPLLARLLDSLGPVSTLSQALFYAGLLLTLLVPPLSVNYFRRKKVFAFSAGTISAIFIAGAAAFLFLLAIASSFHD